MATTIAELSERAAGRKTLRLPVVVGQWRRLVEQAPRPTRCSAREPWTVSGEMRAAGRPHRCASAWSETNGFGTGRLNGHARQLPTGRSPEL